MHCSHDFDIFPFGIRNFNLTHKTKQSILIKELLDAI